MGIQFRSALHHIFYQCLRFLCTILQYLQKIQNKRAIIKISIGTFLILGLHDTILQICTKIYSVVGLPNLYVLSSFIVMLVCYWLIRLVFRHCPVLLGK